MKTMLFKLNLVVAILSVVLFVSAQEKPMPAKPKTVPEKKLPPMHTPIKSRFSLPVQYLMKFSGKWSADALFTTGGKTDTVKYQVIGRSVADGEAMLIEESFNDSTLGKMRGINLAAYDSAAGKVFWYSTSNQYGPHEHTGTWISSDSLYLEHKSVRKGKNYAEKIYFTFKGRDQLLLNFSATQDGKETEKVTAVFNRDMPPLKKPANAAPEKKE